MKTSLCNKRFLCAAALALGILSSTTAQAQLGGVPLWTNRYDGPANGDDQARAMAVDGSGNVIITGSSTSSGSGLDYLTIAYSSGGVPLWTNLYNGPGNGDDQARAVAVDGNGNVFVTGSSTGTAGGLDYAAIAYTGGGMALWTNRYNGPADLDDQARAVAVDRSGDVFVTGDSTGTNFFGYPDYATIKYSGAGVPLWTNRYGGSTFAKATAMAVDRSGNVFVTGSSGGFYATIAYSGTGVPLWTNRVGGPGSAFAMAVDSSGNAFVTGDSHFHLGDSIYETKKYSGAGEALWTRYYYSLGPNPSEYPAAMAVDASGNVFVTGRSGSYNVSDYATVAYSGAGVPLWANRYDGPANTNDVATAVAVDGSGNVFVTGYSTGVGSGYDYATIKYSLVPPSLTVARTTTNTVAVSWPSPSTGFTLQQNTNGIATANWRDVVTMPSDDGTTRSVIVNPPTGNRFYRLTHP